MANTINLIVVSQEQKLFEGIVEVVNVTSNEGELGIYPGHSPLLATLKPGIVSYKQNGELKTFYTSGGFLEVQPTVVSILADVAIRAEELDRERILRAKQRCEDRLAQSTDDLEAVSAKLKREIAKLRAYELVNIQQHK